MRIKDVDIPDIILDSQDSGSLVVFVGAGVSVDSPPNLPLFDQLANQIAGNIEQKKDEPVDSFLGRLEKENIDVHKRTLDIIGKATSMPNTLHKSIVALFSMQKSIRIVTTNFDSHFTTIINDGTHDLVETYYAPALPLGRDFTGLVYLHGSVMKDPKTMVITDKDIGKAYLNDGWATKFLCEMFEKAVVLFIGYSHHDPAMKYLARGLNNANGRFALTTQDQENHWRFLGVEPLVYPCQDGCHGVLREVLEEWAKLTSMGLIEREQRIKQIVSLEPPADIEADDYVARMVKNPITCTFFRRHAKIMGWLIWAEKRELLTPLFQSYKELNDIGYILAEWFVENYMTEYCDDAIGVIQRQGLYLHPHMWSTLAVQLSRTEMDAKTRLKWVTILLVSAQDIFPLFPLDYILADCKFPEDRTAAVLLFEFLSKPKLKLKPHINWYASGEHDVQSYDAEITISGEEYFLKEAWGKVFQPNIGIFAEQMEPILTLHLLKTHQLLLGIGKANDRWDPVSFSRSAIEPHDQDKYPKDIDVLIDAARNTIECLNSADPNHAFSICNKWANSAALILQRLAIHGIAESSLSAEEKLDWIINRGWLFGTGRKHEVFVLLRKAFPFASSDVKLEVLNQAVLGVSSDFESLDKKTIKYEIYNILVWLAINDPYFCPIQNAINDIKLEYPDFEPREHPDFDSWMGPVEWVSPRSPISGEELLASPLEDKIEWILTFKGESSWGSEKAGLLTVVKEVAQSNYSWSRKFGYELEVREVVDGEVWNSLLLAWRDTVLSPEQWKEILNFLKRNLHLMQKSFHTVMDLLDDGIEKESGKIPTRFLVSAESLVDTIYESCADVEQSDDSDEFSSDWLMVAINTLCGKAVLFWVKSFSKRRKETFKAKFPGRYKNFFQKAATKNSPLWDAGVVVLASQLHFFYACDEIWTRSYILPLLNPQNNENRAIKAWFGYFGWGRWNEAILADVMPLLEKLLEMSNIPEKLWKNMAVYLSGIAVHSSINPIESGYLMNFIAKTNEPARENWALSVSHWIESADQNSIIRVWNGWLNNYWKLRNENIPVVLSENEKKIMILWVVHLEAIFDTAVDRVCDSPAPIYGHTRIYKMLLDKNIAKRFPVSSVRLLNHLLTATNVSNYSFEEINLLYKELLIAGASTEELYKICEQLARLGYDRASELKLLLDERDQGTFLQ